MNLEVKRILVPIDYSENALLAKDFALAQAKVFGAQVNLLHVVDNTTYESYLQKGFMGELPVYLPIGQAPHGSPMEEKIEEFMNKAKAELDSYAGPHGAEVVTTLRQGNVVQEVLNEAKEYGADMIIMCTHGWTGIKHLMMGSTTERIVRMSEIPVLTIRGKHG